MRKLVGKHQSETAQSQTTKLLGTSPAQANSPSLTAPAHRSAPTSLASTAASFDLHEPQTARAATRPRAWPPLHSDNPRFSATADAAELERLSAPPSAAKSNTSRAFSEKDFLVSSALPFSAIENSGNQPSTSSIPRPLRPRAMSSSNIAKPTVSAVKSSAVTTAANSKAAGASSLSSAQTCFNAGEAMLRVRVRLAVSELVKNSEGLPFGESLLQASLPQAADLAPVLLLFERAVALDSGYASFFYRLLI